MKTNTDFLKLLGARLSFNYPANQVKSGRNKWGVRLEVPGSIVEIAKHKGDGVVGSPVGIGTKPNDALRDLSDSIRGKVAVLHFATPQKEEIDIPKDLELTQPLSLSQFDKVLRYHSHLKHAHQQALQRGIEIHLGEES